MRFEQQIQKPPQALIYSSPNAPQICVFDYESSFSHIASVARTLHLGNRVLVE